MAITLQKFLIESAAGNLEGIAHRPNESPRALAVVAHPLPTMGGTMENKVVTTLAKTFAELGFVALRFNFRGAGGSEGTFDDGDGEVEDVLAVVRHARQEYGDLPLILSGFSFGGYVQARAAQLLHPQRLVLVAPAVGRFLPSTTLITGDFAGAVGQPSRVASSSIRTGMPPVPHNTLLIHGDEDGVIPLADVLHWARQQKLPVVVLPGAEHFFHGRLGQIREIVLNAFNGQPL